MLQEQFSLNAWMIFSIQRSLDSKHHTTFLIFGNKSLFVLLDDANLEIQGD